MRNCIIQTPVGLNPTIAASRHPEDPSQAVIQWTVEVADAVNISIYSGETYSPVGCSLGTLQLLKAA